MSSFTLVRALIKRLSVSLFLDVARVILNLVVFVVALIGRILSRVVADVHLLDAAHMTREAH